jgi:hypothetical protein
VGVRGPYFVQQRKVEPVARNWLLQPTRGVAECDDAYLIVGVFSRGQQSGGFHSESGGVAAHHAPGLIQGNDDGPLLLRCPGTRHKQKRHQNKRDKR